MNERPNRKATCPACKTSDQDIDEMFHIGRVAPHYGDEGFSQCDGGWPNPPVGFGPKIDFSSFEGKSTREILLLEDQIYEDDEESKNQLRNLISRRVVSLIRDTNAARLAIATMEVSKRIKDKKRHKDDVFGLHMIESLLTAAGGAVPGLEACFSDER